jgi:hypothetical protein
MSLGAENARKPKPLLLPATEVENSRVGRFLGTISRAFETNQVLKAPPNSMRRPV